MKSYKIISWNVNGLRAVIKKGALESIWQLSPDIVCLQETKIDAESITPELRSFGDYQGYFCSAEKKGYSGVVIYSRIKPQKIDCGFGDPRFDNEGRTVRADFGDFVLFNTYFPNGKASSERLKYKMDFYESYLHAIDTLKNNNRNIVICGDVNTAHREIDLARPKENEKVSGFLPEERAWIDTLLTHGYIDSFRTFDSSPEKYTWWDLKSRARDRNIGWRIDYFYTSNGLQNYTTGAAIHTDITGSDHCPISLELSF